MNELLQFMVRCEKVWLARIGILFIHTSYVQHISRTVLPEKSNYNHNDKKVMKKSKEKSLIRVFVFVLRFAHEVASVQVIFIIPNLVDRSQKMKQAVAKKQINDLQREWEIQQ